MVSSLHPDLHCPRVCPGLWGGSCVCHQRRATSYPSPITLWLAPSPGPCQASSGASRRVRGSVSAEPGMSSHIPCWEASSSDPSSDPGRINSVPATFRFPPPAAVVALSLPPRRRASSPVFVPVRLRHPATRDPYVLDPRRARRRRRPPLGGRARGRARIMHRPRPCPHLHDPAALTTAGHLASVARIAIGRISLDLPPLA